MLILLFETALEFSQISLNPLAVVCYCSIATWMQKMAFLKTPKNMCVLPRRLQKPPVAPDWVLEQLVEASMQLYQQNQTLLLHEGLGKSVKILKLFAGLNPKPHGSGRICPHYFQRPITQKGLKQKNPQKSAIPRKMSAE